MTTAPLPVTLISGYLGAGKTTLVNHVLRNAKGRKLMVMVNDFGELPIDADLIETDDGDTITLANGCICCSMNGDLAGAFIDLLNRDPLPDHLLIEASGVAEPNRIANLARAEPDLSLHGIVVLADCANLERQLSDPLINCTVNKQLAAADLLVLNKADLVSESEFAKLEGALSGRYPRPRLIPGTNAEIPVDLLADLPASEFQAEGKDGHHHSDVYVRWSTNSTQPFDIDHLKTALGSLPDGLLRLKGIVSINSKNNAYVVQCVGNRCTLQSIDTPAPQQSGLVAIGLRGKTNLQTLEDLFNSCRHEG